MSSILKAFVLGESSWDVRITHDEHGNPWFCANDVGIVLEIAKVRNSIAEYDEDQRRPVQYPTPGGLQEMIFLSKDGLFRLLMQSRKPIAKPFQKWICKILDEIEKTGRYELQRSLEDEAKAVKENMERQLAETKTQAAQKLHDALVQAHDNKTCLYVAVVGYCVDLQKDIVKLGETGNIRGRVTGLKTEYGKCLLLAVYECVNAHKLEQFLLKNHVVARRKWSNGRLRQDHQDKELICFDNDFDFDALHKLISDNMRHFSASSEAESSLRLQMMQVKEKALEAMLSSGKFSSAEELVSVLNAIEHVPPSPRIEEAPAPSSQQPAGLRHALKQSVQKYHAETLEMVGSYDSIAEAVRDVRGERWGLLNAIHKRTVYFGCYWRAVDACDKDVPVAFEPPLIAANPRRSFRAIAKLNEDGTRVVDVFPTFKAAGASIDMSDNTIMDAIRLRVAKRGFFWAYWDTLGPEVRATWAGENPASFRVCNFSRRVELLDVATRQVVRSYDRMTDACRDFQTSHKSVHRYSESGNIFKGYIWRVSP